MYINEDKMFFKAYLVAVIFCLLVLAAPKAANARPGSDVRPSHLSSRRLSAMSGFFHRIRSWFKPDGTDEEGFENEDDFLFGENDIEDVIDFAMSGTPYYKTKNNRKKHNRNNNDNNGTSNNNNNDNRNDSDNLVAEMPSEASSASSANSLQETPSEFLDHVREQVELWVTQIMEEIPNVDMASGQEFDLAKAFNIHDSIDCLAGNFI